MISPNRVAWLLGSVALAMIIGALGFQYIGHIPPCEMCHWQRWPLIAAAIVGIVGAALAPPRVQIPIAWLVVLLVAIAGLLGVFHAGVEWHWWKGPQHCTGAAVLSGDLNTPIVRCDAAAWRLFGLSLAGYNAIISLGLAGLGTWSLLTRKNA